MEQSKQVSNNNSGGDSLSNFASVAGTILGISYPVLALSTGARALYQLFLKEGVDYYIPPLLTLTAALLYLTATVGFTRRRRWAWWVSVVALALETILTLLVGTLSIVQPDLVGHNTWSYFGADYAFFPLIQPVLGLIWLLHPETKRAYAIGGPSRRAAT